jgi:hypothetical protein
MHFIFFIPPPPPPPPLSSHFFPDPYFLCRAPNDVENQRGWEKTVKKSGGVRPLAIELPKEEEPKERFIPDGEKLFCQAVIEKYGDDWVRASRDMKLNAYYFCTDQHQKKQVALIISSLIKINSHLFC